MCHVAKMKRANISYAKKKLHDNFPMYDISNDVCNIGYSELMMSPSPASPPGIRN